MGVSARKDAIVLCIAILVLMATGFHAFMVLLVNMPPNALKSAFAPALSLYRGPELAQGWALFAPGVNIGNTHVIIRARLRSGKVTGWYDATEFFAVQMRQNRFTPTRALSEVLSHSADTVIVHENRQPDRDSLIRVAAMVLREYVPASQIRDVQVELDRWSIARPGALERGSVDLVKQLSWAPMPDVSKI